MSGSAGSRFRIDATPRAGSEQLFPRAARPLVFYLLWIVVVTLLAALGVLIVFLGISG